MPFIVSAVTAVAGAIGGALAAGGIAGALIRLGGTLLLSYASQALMPTSRNWAGVRSARLRRWRWRARQVPSSASAA